ncbi:hypothetical protein Lreu23DRAFT_3854 [Limosilactobacillus reuteri subsp. rodentium]|uniref:Uncharacterized protein n=1 Tax=Limosilactobacillus reuteri subsp. rodentium (strain DSM 17509 / CIP 109821 / 100-23) TaxID=349123 RepID=B3XLH7_LIMR1|nr:hypothetical protein Lreu23DRAFT_3854 [Limosilactobacillus reuteri subsp. rodentium]
MVDFTEHSINKEELVALFFTKEMEFNDLQTFFYKFHPKCQFKLEKS